MTPRLTVYFIVEPPGYETLACYLAASLREQFTDTVALVGYCPAHKLAAIDPQVTEILEKLGCEVRPFAAEGRFDPAYPHGNKILASMERRDTEFSAFMDSDILCLKPNAVENIVKEGHVSLSLAASMKWAPQTVWETVYAAAGMEQPGERYRLMRQQKGRPRMPYFSSGLFTFPESHRTPEGRSFPEVWMEVAQTLDAHPEVPKKRPYLDQLSLPLAIRKAGLDWNILPEAQHYILGGKMKGSPVPEGEDPFTVHYRQWKILKRAGLSGIAKTLLQRHAGVKKLGKMPQE